MPSIAARLTWKRSRDVDTPPAYWSYLRRYPRGFHANDARRRLAYLTAALEPPPRFDIISYDVQPPPPDEVIYIERPILIFDDPDFGFEPPPPPPVFFLPPRPVYFVDLVPPPPPVFAFNVSDEDPGDGAGDGCFEVLGCEPAWNKISSLTFRSGTITADGTVAINPTARLAAVPKVRSRTTTPNGDDIEVIIRADEELSERIIFPIADAQSNGIEDARFVEFNDGGRRTFYATYTAYSGNAIRSELIETTDFRSFRMTPFAGSAACNKGMALFPRKELSRPFRQFRKTLDRPKRACAAALRCRPGREHLPRTGNRCGKERAWWRRRLPHGRPND